MPPPKQTSRAPDGRAARLAGQPYTRCTNILLFFVHYFSRCSSQKYAILEKENPVEFLLPRLCAAPRTGPCRAVRRAVQRDPAALCLRAGVCQRSDALWAGKRRACRVALCRRALRGLAACLPAGSGRGVCASVRPIV